MLSLSTRVIAKQAFTECTHYTKSLNGMVSGSMVEKCDCCNEEMVCFTTGAISFSEDNGKGSIPVDMLEVMKYLGLRELNPNIHQDCSNVEDYNDEYAVVCPDCNEEIMEAYYASN